MNTQRHPAFSIPVPKLVTRLALVPLLLLIFVLGTQSALAQAPIVEEYFVPLPEQQLQYNDGIGGTPLGSFGRINTDAAGNVNTRISIAIGGDTVIYYDHWENGFEAVISSPANLYNAGGACGTANPGGTQIWGNGNLCDGTAPGHPTDLLTNGDVVVLANAVSVPRNPATIRYDGRDKFAATYPVAVTRRAYCAVGGMPEIPLGEDGAFIARLLEHGLRVRHATDVCVTISARLAGRAPGGVADTIRSRCEEPDALCDARMETFPRSVRRYLWRRRFRRMHGLRSDPCHRMTQSNWVNDNSSVAGRLPGRSTYRFSAQLSFDYNMP